MRGPLTASRLGDLDASDPVAGFRDRFILPKGIYLDGNSLGQAPKETSAVLKQVIEEQWGADLITSWNKHAWITLPQRLGAKLSRLLGAEPGEIVACDSTSLNIFKAVSAALDLRPGRTHIVSERWSFPTDLYMLEGLARVRGNHNRTVHLDDPDEILQGRVDLREAAVVLLSHVSYRTGRLLDMEAITAAVHKSGALIVWDLAHSAGAVPVHLNAADVDFAVGCGYKFLNGGPGAPAFIFVAERHQAAAINPLSGWFGHKEAFAFEHGYRPANGISRFLCGTSPILGLAALEVGVDIHLEVDQSQLREKSVALGELLLRLLEQECGEWGFRLHSPPEPEQRGSQVNICHEHAYSIVQALIKRGVTGDFRSPDILRLGFAPLYTRYQDVWTAIQHLKQVMQGAEWDRAEYKTQTAVT